MTIKKEGVLYAQGIKPLLYDCTFNDTPGLKPVVVFCHGYKGFKDWGAWHLVAESFAKAGFFFLKFNFSHNGGTLEQPMDFPDLEAFAQNNFTKELDDLERVLSFLFQPNEYKPIIDLENISLIGHSRGGGIVLIKAEEDARVKKVISWASVSDFRLLFKENSESFLKWKTTGRTYVENTRTKQLLPHDWQFYEDFKQHQERLTIKRAVSNLSKPQLIIHGLKDPTVSASEARLMHQWNPKSQLELIPEGDHVFGSSHPFTSANLPLDLKTVVDMTVRYVNIS